jgi:hypothetical protein
VSSRDLRCEKRETPHLSSHVEGGVKRSNRRLALPLPGSVTYAVHGVPRRERSPA